MKRYLIFIIILLIGGLIFYYFRQDLFINSNNDCYVVCSDKIDYCKYLSQENLVSGKNISINVIDISTLTKKQVGNLANDEEYISLPVTVCNGVVYNGVQHTLFVHDNPIILDSAVLRTIVISSVVILIIGFLYKVLPIAYEKKM